MDAQDSPVDPSFSPSNDEDAASEAEETAAFATFNKALLILPVDALNATVSCITCVLYVISTYVNSEALFLLDLALGGYFVFDLVIRFVLATDRRRHWSSFSTWLDVITILPSFAELAIVLSPPRQRYATSDLQGTYWVELFMTARVLRILRLARIFSYVQSELTRQSMKIVLTIVALIYIAAGAMQAVERDALDWEFHDMCYFIIITLTTVGYGSDIAPVTDIGRIAICAFIVVSLLLIPVQTNEMIRILKMHGGGHASRQFHPQGDQFHFVLAGSNVGAHNLLTFLSQLLRSQLQPVQAHVVLIQNSHPPYPIERIMRSATYQSMLTYLEGNIMDDADLNRAQVYSPHCRAVVLCANRTTADLQKEDDRNIVKALALKTYFLRHRIDSVRICLQLYHWESRRRHLFGVLKGEGDIVIVIEAYKAALLAKSVLCRGLCAFIHNLLVRGSAVGTTGALSEEEIALEMPSDWTYAYYLGRTMQLVVAPLTAPWEGFDFHDVVSMFYEETHSILFALEYPQSDGIAATRAAILLNPICFTIYDPASTPPSDTNNLKPPSHGSRRRDSTEDEKRSVIRGFWLTSQPERIRDLAEGGPQLFRRKVAPRPTAYTYAPSSPDVPEVTEMGGGRKRVSLIDEFGQPVPRAVPEMEQSPSREESFHETPADEGGNCTEREPSPMPPPAEADSTNKTSGLPLAFEEAGANSTQGTLTLPIETRRCGEPSVRPTRWQRRDRLPSVTDAAETMTLDLFDRNLRTNYHISSADPEGSPRIFIWWPRSSECIIDNAQHLSGHIVICGARPSLIPLVHHLRCKSIFGNRVLPIVLLTATHPGVSLWRSMAYLRDIYIVLGSSMETIDLWRANIGKARMVIILHQRERMRLQANVLHQDDIVDVSTIFTYKAIKRTWPHKSVVCDLEFTTNISALCAEGLIKPSQAQNSDGLADMRSGPAERLSPESSLYSPIFASGEVLPSALLDGLTVKALESRAFLHLIETLLQVQAPPSLPSSWVNVQPPVYQKLPISKPTRRKRPASLTSAITGSVKSINPFTPCTPQREGSISSRSRRRRSSMMIFARFIKGMRQSGSSKVLSMQHTSASGLQSTVTGLSPRLRRKRTEGLKYVPHESIETSTLQLIRVPPEFELSTYGDMVDEFIGMRRIIPLGLLVGGGVHDNPLPYVLTNPPPRTRLTSADHVYVLQPPVSTASPPGKAQSASHRGSPDFQPAIRQASQRMRGLMERVHRLRNRAQNLDRELKQGLLSERVTQEVRETIHSELQLQRRQTVGLPHVLPPAPVNEGDPPQQNEDAE
ncbi:unnamed protein product [Vitrella brassicaformis CCMP3155]|uniref:Ion transport domain-containing protein n=2 Tax=Vitrella brassicaformis TaxID=1169539 RepID=A0A0G4GUC0_VITBC|nr:unnamed protein product [Vitrella brassicaformis CCMP3155]|eukprot:CEM34434.1 unnamed protein product [Vitrella brassicaformis CCMP3155]